VRAYVRLFVQWESDGVCVDSLLPAGASREAELARLAQSYEDLCKEHVDAYLKSAQEFLSSSLLSRRVLEWQERLQPILEEEERHKPFDIHAYGRDILTAVDENKNEEQGRLKETHRGRTVALTHHLLTAYSILVRLFSVHVGQWSILPLPCAVRRVTRSDAPCVASSYVIYVVHCLTRHSMYCSALVCVQVCRLFLATLQLANAGNVEIQRAVTTGLSHNDNANGEAISAATMALKLISMDDHNLAALPAAAEAAAAAPAAAEPLPAAAPSKPKGKRKRAAATVVAAAAVVAPGVENAFPMSIQEHGPADSSSDGGPSKRAHTQPQPQTPRAPFQPLQASDTNRRARAH
jgi:hypothetical protein